jgi:hypothetical protein
MIVFFYLFLAAPSDLPLSEDFIGKRNDGRNNGFASDLPLAPRPYRIGRASQGGGIDSV